VQYQYDDNGNLIREDSCGQVTLFEYDFENRLAKITYPDGRVEDYLYDYAGHLVRKTIGGVTTTSIYGMNVSPYTEKNESTGEVTDFLMANGKTYEKLAGSTPTFFHCDALGTVLALSGETGIVTDTYEDDPFGKQLTHNGTSVNTYQFVGCYGVRDISNSRFIMGVRLYDAEVGRFLQEDSIGFRGGINFYRYTGNNPLVRFDYDGREWQVNYGGSSMVGVFIYGGLGYNFGLNSSGQLVIQLQAGYSFGPGAFIGGGTQVGGGHSSCPTKDWFSGKVVSEINANVAWGEGVGGVLQFDDKNDEFSLMGGIKPEYGFGAEVSAGNTAVGTLAIPIGHWLFPDIFPEHPSETLF